MAASPTVHTVRHTVTVDADPDDVYRIVADAARWPLVFGPTVHVERLEGDDRDELLALWATANGEVRHWTSRRQLDPAARRIDFRQQTPPPPLAAMGGTWTLEPLTPGSTRVLLDHDFAAIDDDPQAVEWIGRATDSNSNAELAALKRAAEQGTAGDELTMTFTDVVDIGGPPAEVYAFLADAQHWPERLPHVSRLELDEPQPGLQIMEMDTRTKDGSVHTTKSVRVCFEPERIVYKQIEPPALLDVHTGDWRFAPHGGGTRASSTHSIRIRTEAIGRVLGDGATVEDAKAFVHQALSTNSTTTLQQAKAAVERSRTGAARG
jgi:aromatase